MKLKIQKNASKIPILKALFLISFILVGFFGFGITPKVFADSTDCAAQATLSVNPTSGASNQKFTISGSVTVQNVSPGGGVNDSPSCNYPGDNPILGHTVSIIYVTVYDKNTGQNLLSDIALSLTAPQTITRQPNTGSETLSLPSGYTFTPNSSFGNNTATLLVAALPKVLSPINNQPANLTESAPVSVAITTSLPTSITLGGCSNSNQNNTGCLLNNGVGYVCQNSSCVAATDFSCSSGSSNCPSGLKCVGNQCLEPCSSNSSCDWQGETCDTKAGSSTLNYCTDATGAGPSTPPSTPPATTAATGPSGNPSTILINPIQKFNDLTDLLVNIMKGFLGIIAVWAVAFIVIGGFKMVISSGNEEAVLSARKTITWAVLGLLVAVLSFAIIAIVQNLIGVTVPARTPTSYYIQPVDKT